MRWAAGGTDVPRRTESGRWEVVVAVVVAAVVPAVLDELEEVVPEEDGPQDQDSLKMEALHL